MKPEEIKDKEEKEMNEKNPVEGAADDCQKQAEGASNADDMAEDTAFADKESAEEKAAKKSATTKISSSE